MAAGPDAYFSTAPFAGTLFSMLFLAEPVAGLRMAFGIPIATAMRTTPMLTTGTAIDYQHYEQAQSLCALSQATHQRIAHRLRPASAVQGDCVTSVKSARQLDQAVGSEKRQKKVVLEALSLCSPASVFWGGSPDRTKAYVRAWPTGRSNQPGQVLAVHEGEVPEATLDTVYPDLPE